MMTTLQAALAPLLNFGSFLGLGFFEYHGHSMPYLSCPYVLAKWGLIMYFVYYPIFFVRIFENPNYLLKIWGSIVILIITITSILASWFHFKELKMCLRELSLVDDTMEAIGLPKKYQRLRKWIIRITIGYIVYIFYQLAIYTFTVKFLYQFDINFYVILSIIYPDFVYGSYTLILGSVLGYVSFKFHQVSDRLHVLYPGLSENNVNYRRQNRFNLECQRITDAEDRKQYIWIIMHVHLQLCFISHKLNKVLKILMLSQLSWYFIKSVGVCLYICGVLINRDEELHWTFRYSLEYLHSFTDFILHSILYFTLNYVCQTVYCKINETVAILHKLSSYNLDEELRELVNNNNKILFRILIILCVILLALTEIRILQFILQIKLKEVKFGVGYFCYGYNLFFQTYRAALAFFMILMQFDLVINYDENAY